MATGANVHYVDTGAKNLLFHPKIYLCRCKARATAIIGSANLTVGGLNNNIESSVVLDLNLDSDEDLAFVESVMTEFDGLPSEYASHVVRVENTRHLEDLHDQGRLADEASSTPPHAAGSAAKKPDALPPIALKVPRLSARIRRPKAGKGTPRSPPTLASGVTDSHSSVTSTLGLVWRSKSLTERDLGVPSGTNTHATGSINLDKGLLDEDVDHRHYFRDDVFVALDWTPRSSTVDEADANFGLIVAGVARGDFSLRIRHSTSTESTSYLQRNAMTRLSWGPMKQFVARQELIGRTMSLYRDKSDLKRFVVEID